MNCKKGDLAYVTSGAKTPSLAGRFVIVERAAPYGDVRLSGELWVGVDTPAWICRGANGGDLPCQRLDGSTYSMPRRLIDDAILRPIRPQPDDAVDEVIQRIGTPHKETA
jgi:hypothetical protein